MGVFNCGDGATAEDVQVRFREFSFGFGISEYRIYLVPPPDTSSFLTNYESILPPAYLAHTNTGTLRQEENLTSSMTDINGTPVLNGVEYLVAIASIADGVLTHFSSVVFSDPFKLLYPPPKVTELLIADCCDSGDPKNDLSFQFKALVDESQVHYYDILAIPTDSVANANICGMHGKVVYPTGVSIRTGVFDARDVYHNAIVEGLNYQLLVKTYGIDTLLGISFSDFSDTLMLGPGVTLPDGTALDKASDLLISDEGNSGGAADIRLRFQRAADETDLEAYRVFVLPPSPLGTPFNASTAVSITNTTRYKAVLPDGTDKDVFLDETMRDINGDTIEEGIPYRVMVLGKSSEFWNPISSISAPSNVLILSPKPIPIEIPDDGDDDDTW